MAGGDDSQVLARQAALLRKAYATKGARGYWSYRLQRLESQRASANSWDAIFLAEIYTRLGKNDEAFRWLDVAFKQHVPYLIWHLPANPDFDALRSDPRYADLLQRLVPRPE